MDSKKSILSLVLLSLLLTGCEKDLFDLEKYRANMAAAFPFADVDPQHTWTTIGTAEVALGLQMNTGEEYDVRIYDEDPIGSTESLTLLAQGTVKDGESLNTRLSYTLDKNYVFVALFDKDNFMSVYPFGIVDGKIEGVIGTEPAEESRKMAPQRQQAHSYNFPDAPSASLFASSIPSGAKSVDKYYETQNGNYAIKTSDTQINVWNGNCNLYFGPGTYNITSLAVNNNTNIYLLSGAVVNMPIEQKYANVNVYIAGGATLKGKINTNVHIYNRGTIESTGNSSGLILYSSYNPWWNDPNASDGLIYNEGTIKVTGNTGTINCNSHTQFVNAGIIIADKIVVDENGQLLNKGSLTVNGHLGVENTESLFINEGECTVGSTGVAGSADLYNDGMMTVQGETTVSSNQCTWHNDGTYITNKFTYTAGSTDVINNCKMIVNDRFYIGLGDTDRNSFQMNGGASVVTKDFEFSGPGFINMGSGSLFQVTNIAYMAITKDVYGIYGPSKGGYAVFQAKEIARRSDINVRQGFVANYFNRLYVATDKHFNFGYSDKDDNQIANGEVGNQPFYRLDSKSGAKMSSYNGADVTIAEGECSPGYGGQPQEEEPEAGAMGLRYCFEDNFPQLGDYDFNDAVITVTPTINGKNVTLKVTLDAVGATKQLAAAIRVVGLKESDIKSCTRTGNLDEDYPNTSRVVINGIGSNGLLPNAYKNNMTDVVIGLFNNAHWSIGHTIASIGSVQNWFYNTVNPTSGYASKKNGVAPAEVTFTFELNSDEAAAHFTEKDLDVFILEPYNSAYWEVHTVPFKTDEVIKEYATNRKKELYSDNFPWAICVPGNFRYPYEWTIIGDNKNGKIVGAYSEPGHSFAEWASNQSTATDWYKYPTKESIYIP
jgi:LruC domain-containing protein